MQKAIKDTVEILNKLEGVEVGRLFYYSVVSVLFDSNKSVAFLRCLPKHVWDG